MATVTTKVLLLMSALLTATIVRGSEPVDVASSDCQPEMPPELPINPNASSTMVALQMHQWVWIENLTAPDWAQRTDSGGMFYEFLKPGYLRQQTLLIRTLFHQTGRSVNINVTFVTNGETLCASALTEYRNRSSGALNRVSCNRICHENFTTLGTRANLPILVYDDWVVQSRFNEYLAFDSVDPESRAAYNCTGYFKLELMKNLPQFVNRYAKCMDGDECLFNYRKAQYGGFVSAGCKRSFAEYNWCVSDISLCSFNIAGDCPICCRGELCNQGIANEAHKRWLEGGSAATAASALWLLAVSCFIVLQLMRLS